jgi:quercetin dioxygenase-like cupin family protein
LTDTTLPSNSRSSEAPAGAAEAAGAAVRPATTRLADHLQSPAERRAKLRQSLAPPTLGRMTEPTVIPPGGGEIVGNSPDRRVEILSDHDALHATWVRFGPGRDGADLHIHRRHTDLFYVLAGELTVRLGVDGEEVAVAAGKLVRVPPFVVHGFRNAGDAELRYLNLHAPGVGFARYMRGLRDGRRVPFDQEPPPEEGVRPATEAAIGPADVVVDEIAIAELSGDRPPRVDDHAGFVYVLEGELAITAGDGELRAPAGSWVQVPAGVEHAVVAAEPSRYLDLQAPGRGAEPAH